MKKNKFISFRNFLLAICFVLFLAYPNHGISANYIMNFLPMEDALSATRNISDYDYAKIKPYKEPLPIKKEKAESNILENVDVLAFCLLGIVFFLIVNRRSKSRNLSL